MVAEAERALADIARVRAGVGRVIYGQETVVERALITILAGGHGLLVGVPGLAKTKLVETLGIVLGLAARRIQFTPDLMPSDILGSEVMEQDADGRRSLPLHPGPGLRPAPDGRRDQPRQPAHPVGAAAVDAGVPRHGRRRAPRPAGAVPCARHPEPARAGRHLSAARGAARPLPDADRRRLSRPRGRAADAVRDHRRHRGPGRARARRRERLTEHPAAGPPHAGRRSGGRGDPRPRPLRPARRGQCRRPTSTSPGGPARAPARR